MPKHKPTYEEVTAALGTLLAEYCEIDEMLDGFMAYADATPLEKRRQRINNRIRDRIQKLWVRACK